MRVMKCTQQRACKTVRADRALASAPGSKKAVFAPPCLTTSMSPACFFRGERDLPMPCNVQNFFLETNFSVPIECATVHPSPKWYASIDGQACKVAWGAPLQLPAQPPARLAR
jgi:hypothetical protein